MAVTLRQVSTITYRHCSYRRRQQQLVVIDDTATSSAPQSSERRNCNDRSKSTRPWMPVPEMQCRRRPCRPMLSAVGEDEPRSLPVKHEPHSSRIGYPNRTAMQNVALADAPSGVAKTNGTPAWHQQSRQDQPKTSPATSRAPPGTFANAETVFEEYARALHVFDSQRLFLSRVRPSFASSSIAMHREFIQNESFSCAMCASQRIAGKSR